MSALFNQTNTAPGTFNFISRQEVIEGLSTLASDLSGLNISSFNLAIPANPSFSTIRMPATGLISGYAPIQTSNVILQSSLGAGVINKIQTGGFANQSNIAMAAADSTGATAPLVASSYAAKLGGINSAATYHQLLPTGLQVVDAAGASPNQWMTWNTLVGANSRIALNNISTINGSPPNVNPTTYTTLTGTTINNSGVLTSPSVVGVSSLNALPISAYQNSNNQPWVPYTAATNPGAQTLTPAVRTLITTWSNIPVPPVSGRAAGLSIPIALSMQGTITSNVNVLFSAALGGSFSPGSEVAQQFTFEPAMGPNVSIITLSGVGQMAGAQPVVNIYATTWSSGVQVAVAGASSKFFFQPLGF